MSKKKICHHKNVVHANFWLAGWRRYWSKTDTNTNYKKANTRVVKAYDRAKRLQKLNQWVIRNNKRVKEPI